ncbi:macrolide ABC transporter ATP-binding protein [Desulfosarcina widdelii]|uniref:Macrolide ABC transporter ATP-binding protein n=1 Tax=Desulfosarcina widdelii TaxID=947919 RepID=A0A5K7ZAS5_9BACT|nr:ATP-binding cassette domain-containing protein [Desulfosarcina widdelii]BBO77279.1 macrolide ABC transporter ATP-binding protein [Desulfosarcina widdelii]
MELIPGFVCHRLGFHWPGRCSAKRPVLESVDARFAPGTLTLVTGETGAGKSTLLNLLGGLLRPTGGEIHADGQPISRWPANHRDPWRRNVGIVFQHLALVPDISAAENLLLPLIPRKISWSRMQAQIQKRLVENDLADLGRFPARELSGGQRQRLAVARALSGEPRFILADEPTAFQDDDHARQIIAQLRAAADAGAVTVVCSQDPRLKTSVAFHLRYHLASGRLTRGNPT